MPLSIDNLFAFGLSQKTVEVWRSRGITHLLPLQEKALCDHGFLHGRNLLVVACTSSGKTMIAEMAALKHLEQNRRVVYLVPTKALAEEKYRSFQELYGPLGFRIVISTRERPDTDGLVLEGRYNLLIAVYEKMRSYLVVQPEMLGKVALIVADEIQMVGETGRGATADFLLTKIRAAPYSTQFIGLSAVLGDDAARVAAWLDCDLLSHHERPLELREGVFDPSRNVFAYRCHNTGCRGSESFAASGADPSLHLEYREDEGSDHARENILSLVRHLAEDRKEQTLVFVSTRYASRNWAHRFATGSELPPAVEALEELNQYEDTRSRDLLHETFSRGVAFHNSDLALDLRNLIERHFDSGAIRVLFSTSTLGQGVNLSGRNVIHVPVMISTDPWTGRNVTVALSRGKFRNQGGRGARFQKGQDFGRSMIVARNPMETERLMRDYVDGDLEALDPQLDPENFELCILDMVSSRAATTASALADFFLRTFSGRTFWKLDPAPVIRRIELSVKALSEQRLLSQNDAGKLIITGIGEVTASTGLQLLSVERITNWLRESPGVLSGSGRDPMEALLVLSSTRDAREFPIGAAFHGESFMQWVEPVSERLALQNDTASPVIEQILRPSGGLTREMLPDFKKALILDAWIGTGDTRDIEETYHVYSGTAANLAAHVAWIAQAAAAFARALALPPQFSDALDTLSWRLMLGCGSEGVGLRSLRAQSISRAHLQALIREGYTSVESLAQAKADDLSRLIPLRLAQDIIDEAVRITAPSDARVRAPRKPSERKPRDTRYDRDLPIDRSRRRDSSKVPKERRQPL